MGEKGPQSEELDGGRVVAGIGRKGAGGREGDAESNGDRRGKGAAGDGVMAGGGAGGTLRQREVVDLWWLTGAYTPASEQAVVEHCVGGKHSSAPRLTRCSHSF